MKTTVNQKIKNALVNKEGNMTFKSMLEKSVYNTLLQYGFSPKYEYITFTLWGGFQPITPFYDRETPKQRDKRVKENPKSSYSRILTQKTDKIIGIRYTPDFYFKYKNLNVYIEAKGFENDVFYIKKKLFIKYLDDWFIKTGEYSIYFEIYTKKQLLQAIEIIKDYAERCNSTVD